MSPLTALTYVLPHRFLSSLARRLAYSTSPGTSRWLIDTVTNCPNFFQCLWKLLS